MLQEGGKIWLPHLDCIQDSLEENIEILTRYFNIDLPRNYLTNPLYLATEKVEKELTRCPDLLTNDTQMKPLLDFSATPFYCLSLKTDWIDQDNKSQLKIPSAPTTPVTEKRFSRKFSEILDDTSDSNQSTPKKFRRKLDF
jgi:hypothetical protein